MGSVRTGSAKGERREKQRGFTLVELLVTLTLLGVLVSVAMPFSALVKQRNRESELRHSLLVIRGALDRYKQAADEGHVDKAADASGYPPTLADLVEGVPDKKSLDGRKIYFLRRLPADPMAGSEQGDSESTWETRSYDSSPDAFSSGKDVFDIRSKSEEVGINGIPYNQW